MNDNLVNELNRRAANLREQAAAYPEGSKQRVRFVTRAEAFEDCARIAANTPHLADVKHEGASA